MIYGNKRYHINIFTISPLHRDRIDLYNTVVVIQ